MSSPSFHSPSLSSSASPQKVTLVIGSGSVKCAAGLGVIKALYEAGIKICSIVEKGERAMLEKLPNLKQVLGMVDGA